VKNRTPKSFLRIVIVLGLGLVLSGCQTSPTDVTSITGLTGQLVIQLASATGDGGAVSSSGGVAFPSPAAEITQPALSEINVPSPGTAKVFEWPEVIDLPITPRFNGHDIILAWPHVDWPAFDILSPEHRYFGHSGIVYYSGGRWHAISTEWLRDARERTGVYYPYEEKFVQGPIRSGYPIAFFIAGPWRHQQNLPEYQRRSRLKWFTWPGLQPFAWPGDGEGPPPGEPLVEEIHVYITGLSTQLSGGTIVDFAVEVGDVELLSLRGQPLEVVNADVPMETYAWVDFAVDPGRSFLIVDGDRVDLGIPLQNIRVEGPFVVGSDLPTTVTIEFDPDESLTLNDDGSYTLSLVAQLTIGAE